MAFSCVAAEKPQDAAYKLQPTDVIMITVHNQSDLTTKARVTREGNITFPLLGEVQVQGLTLQELEQKLRVLLEKDYLVTAQVLVFIEEYHVRQITVSGEVKSPGKYDLPMEKPLSIMQAIGMAGGFTQDGDVRNVSVMRLEDGVQKVMTVNTKDITVGGQKDKDIIMEPGDIVSVPRGFFQVSVLGEVYKPGKYNLPQEKSITFLEAIAMAGGFTKDADVTKVRVMHVLDGGKQSIVINTKDITDSGDKDKDIVLNPDDIISVPRGFFQVSVLGEVYKPGKYNLPQEKSITLLEAIAMAEGFTKDAEVTKVRVMRVRDGGKQAIVINTKDITDSGDKDKDIVLNPDDIVYVPESFF